MNSHVQDLLPAVVNFHFWKPCNEDCPYCFATFQDDATLASIKGGLAEDECRRILDQLPGAGAQRVNFAGGEPTLAPHLSSLILHAKSVGLQVSIITNGARLEPVLADAGHAIDLAGLSLDSANEATQQRLGRGKGDYVAKTLRLFSLLHQRRIATKLNTVVNRMNVHEDFSAALRLARPARWKALQVLPVGGQNDGRVDALLVSKDEFRSYVARHAPVVEELAIHLADEANEEMTGSYAMIDPAGRFFSNATGRHVYSRPINDVGIEKAFKDVTFNAAGFLARGGDYSLASLVQIGRTATRGRP